MNFNQSRRFLAVARRGVAAWLGLLGAVLAAAGAGTLTVQSAVRGPTPEVIGMNSGHFYSGGNTRDWWRYAGVNGARLFISPAEIEQSDDLPPVGDGVTNQASFVVRRAALRADPLNPDHINWAYFSNRFETLDLYPNNHIRPSPAMRELRALGVEILAQITVSQSRFPIADAADWGGRWELWQHCYAHAFFLAREFNVRRFQMYNEPDLAVTLTDADWLQRLQLASDAFQCAVADVNARHGKALAPLVFAPVNAGNAASDYPTIGGLAVTNRHVDFLGVTNPAFLLLQKYDYHQYNSTPGNYSADLATLRGLLAATMTNAVPPETPLPAVITEFNTRTGANFDTTASTLDTPAEYSAFGGIVVNLAEAGISEMYAFKFSQTERAGGNYPVQKNALHYVDNQTLPFEVGGITRAGEVWRLFNKAAVPGRQRLAFTTSGAASNLDTLAARDAAAQRFWLFCANDNSSAAGFTAGFSAWNVPSNSLVLVEEVSETLYGGVRHWTNLGAARTLAANMGSNSVWLFSLHAAAQQPEQILVTTHDAEVRDGTNKNVNFGTNAILRVRNDPANAAGRSAVLMKFQLPAFDPARLQFALLSVHAGTSAGNTTAQAHVYALDAANWSQESVTWANAPNLKDDVPAGGFITNGFVEGAGTGAFLAGQLVAGSTNFTEKLLDVTELLRARTNTAVSFLVAQTPRWDVALPSLDDGDVQPDGLSIVSSEGQSVAVRAPRLRLVFSAVSVTNSAPSVTNDAYNVDEDAVLNVAAPGVLGNDADPDGAAPVAVLVSGPAHGMVTLLTNGAFIYTPATNYFGTDGFTYAAHDGSATSAVASVTITVAPVNDPPVAVDDAATVSQGAAAVLAVLANDNDIDGGALFIQSFTQPANGVVTNSGGGTLSYLPAPAFSGVDAFNYTVADGAGGVDTATVTLTVTATNNPAQTSFVAGVEAVVRGGASAAADVDEAATGYLMVKFNTAPFDAARKAYFQFDLRGAAADTNGPAQFTVQFTDSFKQRVQLWALNQAWTNFSGVLMWNNARANETNSNNLLTNGAFTATPVGAAAFVPVAGTTPATFVIPRLGDVLRDGLVTLALSGVVDAGNNAGGLRIQRTNAVLVVTAPPVANQPARVSAIWFEAGSAVNLLCSGTPAGTYMVESTGDLIAASWQPLATNVAGPDGFWTVGAGAPLGTRFYRVRTP
jgi:hypothetical protein